MKQRRKVYVDRPPGSLLKTPCNTRLILNFKKNQSSACNFWRTKYTRSLETKPPPFLYLKIITTYRLVDTRHLASLILIDFDESGNKFWAKIFTSLRREDVESSMYRCWKEGKQWKSIFNVDIHVFPLTYLAGINYTRNYSNLESPTWHFRRL